MCTTLTSNTSYFDEDLPFLQDNIERNVLGIMLEAPENIRSNVYCATSIDCFTHPTYRKMYKIITDYIAENDYSDLGIEAIEMFYFEEDNKVIDLKIAGLLAELSNECINFSTWRNWIQWLHQSYEKRLFAQCKSAKEFEAAKEKITSLTVKENSNALIDAPNDYISSYDSDRNSLIKTYYSSIDIKLGGFTKGNLIILAARPAMGKTVTALNLATTLAKYNINSLFIELEMTPSEIMQRINSNVLNIPAERLRNRTLTDEELCRFQNFHISEKCKKFSKLINIPAQCKPNITEIENIIRNAKEDVIFIDHIGLVRGDTRSNRYENTTEVVERIKTLALEIEKPIIALCQLSRAVTTREDTRPKLSDLRDSGALEQSADIVLFVHREAYYNPSLNKNKLELIIGKSRSTGCAGEIINLTYNGDYQRITDPLGETKEEIRQCKII